MAHPPAGAMRRRIVRRRSVAPTPNYRGRHPNWGFPTVALRPITPPATAADDLAPRKFVILSVVTAVTALLCLAAAGAEAWRYVIALRGRTEILDPDLVSTSDFLVLLCGWLAFAAGVMTALMVLAALPQWYRAAVDRAGWEPARNDAQIALRLVTPGWNLYGLGQVLSEIAAALRHDDRHPRAYRWAIPVLWVVWAAGGVLALAALIVTFGGSMQAQANAVALHVAVDTAAALVAALFAVTSASFYRSWTGRHRGRYAGWAVAFPAAVAASSD